MCIDQKILINLYSLFLNILVLKSQNYLLSLIYYFYPHRMSLKLPIVSSYGERAYLQLSSEEN